MIYHKNFHFHYLEFPVFTICYLQYYSIIILCKSPLHYYYIFFTFILHLLKNGNFSGRNWKFNFQYMEIKLEIYGNAIGRNWKWNWKYMEINFQKMETLLGKTGNFQFFPIQKRKSVRGAEQRNKPSVFYARSCENGGTNN